MTDEAQISIQAAETDLDAVIRRVEAGEIIILARDGKPVARIAPVKKPIVYGDLAHLGPLVDDDLSLPQEVLDEFEKSVARTARQLKLSAGTRRTPRSKA